MSRIFRMKQNRGNFAIGLIVSDRGGGEGRRSKRRSSLGQRSCQQRWMWRRRKKDREEGEWITGLRGESTLQPLTPIPASLVEQSQLSPPSYYQLPQ